MDGQSIAVVFGGPSPEHEISILTGLQCERILSGLGARVFALYLDRTGTWWHVPADREARYFLAGGLQGATELVLRLSESSGWYRKKAFKSEVLPVDVILNCFHGAFGEGGGAQSLFELMGIPASGGTPSAASLGLDKFAFGAVMRARGIPSAARELFVRGATPSFQPPYIVKPRFGGSSIGIEIVEDAKTLEAVVAASPYMRNGAVVEPYLESAIDLNIAFKTYPELETSLLERPMRPDTRGTGIYSYEDKYTSGAGLENAPRELPADVPNEVTETAEGLARDVAIATGLTGIVRVDLLYVGGELLVNEVNSIPGAMGLYLWPKDVSRGRLLLEVLEEAVQTPTTLNSAAYADGSALRAAGGIASKLTGA